MAIGRSKPRRISSEMLKRVETGSKGREHADRERHDRSEAPA